MFNTFCMEYPQDNIIQVFYNYKLLLIGSNFSDCENVWCCDRNIWCVLASLPHLLHVLLLQPLHHEGLVHPPHVLGLLLAGHGQLLCQPLGLLCYESKVSSHSCHGHKFFIFVHTKPDDLTRHLLIVQACNFLGELHTYWQCLL